MSREDEIRQKYKNLTLQPENCEPLVQVSFPVELPFPKTESYHDAEKMLRNQLAIIAARRAVGDDYLPALRADFGTAQIASMYGCPIFYPTDSEPCCGDHVLKSMEEAALLQTPTLSGGMTDDVMRFQEYFKANKPDDIPIQHPDIQSTMNNLYMIRGNDVFFDFYDYPEEIKTFCRSITDYMLKWLDYVTDGFCEDDQWVYDRGGLWKGRARLSDCTLQMLSPQLYEDFIMEEDAYFLEKVGGGRVHYCGSNPGVIPDILTLKNNTNLEIDCQYHDLVEISQIAPKEMSIIFCDWSNTPGNSGWYRKLMDGAVPEKKNIVILAKADDAEDAKKVYAAVKNQLLK